ncbi:MAG: glycosyltransferase family 9 protein [Phycisphaerales bacterium JB058]
MSLHPTTPLRIVVVCPSWVGDAVMATPALGLIRRSLPGATIGALCKPGVAPILDGLDVYDELITMHPGGVMGHKHSASKLRMRGYDTVLLLTNSFTTALIARMAGAPRRIGYDRDARHLLLTHRLTAPKTDEGKWAIVPAVDYYWHAAETLIAMTTGERVDDLRPADESGAHRLPAGTYMELACTPRDRQEADDVLARAGVLDRPYAVLNPGGNNEAKRWPADRFAALADHLEGTHGLRVLISGSPAEADLASSIAKMAKTEPIALPTLGMTLGSLKSIIERSELLVTNDTGPRHIAAAFGVPMVTLFGPTDHRWTTIPTRPEGPETVLVADPELPLAESANDHPERCRVDRIGLDSVARSVDRLLSAARSGA